MIKDKDLYKWQRRWRQISSIHDQEHFEIRSIVRNSGLARQRQEGRKNEILLEHPAAAAIYSGCRRTHKP